MPVLINRQIYSTSLIELSGWQNNKTSIQWTPGSQSDHINQKIIFSKK